MAERLDKLTPSSGISEGHTRETLRLEHNWNLEGFFGGQGGGSAEFFSDSLFRQGTYTLKTDYATPMVQEKVAAEIQRREAEQLRREELRAENPYQPN